MDTIPLSAMLAELRRELQKAIDEGEGSALKFEVDDIEIELHVTTTVQKDGGIGITIPGVFNAGAKAAATDANAQKLKLKLKLEGPKGEKAKIAGQGTRPP